MKFKDYGDLIEWCENGSGYKWGKRIDITTVGSYKDKGIVEFYLEKDDNTFAHISAYRSREGITDITILEEGLVRKEEQVVVTKVSYVKE